MKSTDPLIAYRFEKSTFTGIWGRGCLHAQEEPPADALHFQGIDDESFGVNNDQKLGYMPQMFIGL